LGEFGLGATLEENDAVVVLVVDDHGGDEQGHRLVRGFQSGRSDAGVRLNHSDPFVGGAGSHASAAARSDASFPWDEARETGAFEGWSRLLVRCRLPDPPLTPLT
jgi:hypothetical protein